jgi:hypothetical protein
MGSERSVLLIAKLRDQMTPGLRGLGRGALQAAGMITGMATAAILAARKLADYASAIVDTSTAMNLSLDTTQALGYVADQTGSSLQGLAGSIRALNTFMTSANTLGSVQNQAMQTLGLTYTQLQAMSPEEMFLTISDRLGMVSDELEQNMLASAVFGNRFGTQVVGALNQTDGSLRTLMADFQASGRAMSGEQLQALKAYCDAMTDIDYRMKALLADALVPMLPAIQGMSDKAEVLAADVLPRLIPLIEDAMTIMMDSLPTVVRLLGLAADGWARISDTIHTGMVGGGQAQELMDSLTRAVETGAITVEQATAEWEAYTAVTRTWGQRLGASLISPIGAMSASLETANQLLNRNRVEITDDFDAIARSSFSAAQVVAQSAQTVGTDGTGGWQQLNGQLTAAIGLFATIRNLAVETVGEMAGEDTETVPGFGGPEKTSRAKAEVIDALKGVNEEADRLAEELYQANKARAVSSAEFQLSLLEQEHALRKQQQTETAAAEQARIQMIAQGTANLFTGLAMAATQGQDALGAWFDNFKARLVELTISSAFQALLGILTPGGFLGGIFGGLFRSGGGQAFVTASAGRVVPGSMGTQGDVIPALLKPGEEVYSRNRVRDESRGGGTTVNITIDHHPILSTASRAEAGRMAVTVRDELRKIGVAI